MKSQIFTIPNLITLVRLAGIPVFVWLLFGADNRLAAAILLGSLGASDWLDGFLARRLNQESSLGRILDPTADRLVILTAIPCLLVDESAPFLFSIISFARECAVTLAVLVLAGMKIDAVKVNWFGKAGTLALLMAFPAFLLSNASVPSGLSDAMGIFAWVAGIPGLALSYYALALYVPEVRKTFKEKEN